MAAAACMAHIRQTGWQFICNRQVGGHARVVDILDYIGKLIANGDGYAVYAHIAVAADILA